MENTKFWIGIARCGHCGKNHYTLKTIPIKAETRELAKAKILSYPRVKKTKNLKVLLDLQEVTVEEYYKAKQDMENDYFFKVQSKQQQNIYCPDLEIFEIEQPKKPLNRTSTNAKLFHHKKQLKNPHYYSRLYDLCNDREEVSFYGL